LDEHSCAAIKKDTGPVVEDDAVIANTKLDSPFIEEDDMDMDSFCTVVPDYAYASPSSSRDLALALV